jgi:hypothetical protein
VPKILTKWYLVRTKDFRIGGRYLIVVYFVLAVLFIMYMNVLMERFCQVKQVPDDKQENVFQTTNILTVILLITTYIEILII